MINMRIGKIPVCLAIVLFCACQDSGSRISSTGKHLFDTPSFRAAPEPAVRVVEESPAGVTLSLDAGSARVGAQSTHGRLFSTLDCSSCGWTSELGKPRLPAMRRFVEAPPGAVVLAEFSTSGIQTSGLAELGARHQIFPVQRPVEKRPGARERTPFEMDEALYSSDSFYPHRSYDIAGPFDMRGHRLFLVEYYPIRYNPYRNQIQTTPGARLRLRFEGGKAERKVESSPAFDAWFGKNVVNYQSRRAKDISTAKYAEGILLVVGNDYASDPDLQNYMETRRDEGHQVTMAPMADIGSSDDNVRAYIISQYQSWSDPALSHVVVIGDVDDVPAYPGHGDSDNFYSAIDPDNYSSDWSAPDLVVTRISVNNSTELKTYLIRADNYLFANFPVDESWTKKIAWIASCDMSSTAEGSHEYVINNYTESLGFTGIIPNNPQPGGDKLFCGDGNASQTDIRSALNDGRLAVDMSGHGSATSWGDPSFSSLSGVEPPDAAPLVLSFACSTGTFDYSGGDCWGEEWLAHSHGAIMFFGASNSTYWGEDDILERRLWDGVFRDNITWLGEITFNAEMELVAHYGATGTVRDYLEMYNALGDGTVDFFTDTPFDALVDYPAELPMGIDAIDFTVTREGTAVEGALVCVRGGVVQQVGYTDSGGQVTLIMDPIPDEVGNLKVTVTAHNMRRHEGEIFVIPSDIPYMMYVSHEITSDGATVAPPNPGRHVIMPITVHNIGTEPGSGVTGTLASDSTAVTITQSQAAFPNIPSQTDARTSTHPEYDILPGTDDGTVVPFRLEWSTAEGSSGTMRFNVTVERPFLVYRSHTVSDAEGECDTDNVADLNELATFTVTLENQGSGNASQVMVGLTANNCNISDPFSVGPMPAGSQGTAVFTVIPQEGVPCPARNVLFTVSADAEELPGPDISTFTETLNADVTGEMFTDDMEGTEPNGWSHNAASGTDDWGYVTTSSHSPSHAWFSASEDNVKDARLLTPPITISDTSQLTFWQRYEFETGYDGAVIEISTNSGTSFSDLGDYITQNGYTHTISTGSSSPIGGRRAWSAARDWHQVTVDLASFGPGEVIIRFRLTCDRRVFEPGWWIDDMEVDAETVVCQQQDCIPPNLPPVANAGPDQQVDGGNQVILDGSQSYDPEGDPITFSWTQTAGAPVTLTNPQSAGPTFIAPQMEGMTDMVFELTVSDPENSDTDSVTVSVWGGCDDANDCTDDIYTGGVCQHVNRVCEEGVSCCNDGNRCTVTDTCQDGVCVGSDPIVCQAQDECHQAGVCDPATGTCSNPAVPDGTECSEGTCQNGECKGKATGCSCSHGRVPISGSVSLLLFLALCLARRRWNP